MCKPDVLGISDAVLANLIFEGNINGIIYLRKSISKRRGNSYAISKAYSVPEVTQIVSGNRNLSQLPQKSMLFLQ